MAEKRRNNMKKLKGYIVLFVVIASFLMAAPSVFKRVYYENNNRHAVLAVKCDGIADFYLKEYKQSGASGAVISEKNGNGFESHDYHIQSNSHQITNMQNLNVL